MDASKMTGKPIPTLISVDPLAPAEHQKGLHNRWHPEIPSVCTVKPNSIFKLEAVDWTGGQIKNDDCADDIRDVDLTKIHNLTGPVDCEGAMPGDLLVVDILDVEVFEQMPWGFTGIFEKKDGGLFATDFDTKAAKAIWDFKGLYAESRHIPGVRFAGIPHPGLIGTKPSPELLALWNRREGKLIHDHKDAQGNDASPAVALPPEKVGAYVGQSLPDEVRKRIYEEGARTVPGREHGGNVDIKNLSRGSRVYLPVYMPGAGLSFGDLHFSMGDGEMSFCGAIEMAGKLTLQLNVIKNGMKDFGCTMPIFLPSPVDPQYSARVIFEGIGVDLHNGTEKQGNMDATMAYKTAARNCIDYIMKMGYTREQAYLLLSAAPVDSHVGSLVDSPNAVVTMSLPCGIFDRDILPKEGGFERRDYGHAALRSDGLRGME